MTFFSRFYPLFSILLLLSASFSFSYDKVEINSVIPLADKKAQPSQLRLDEENQLWMLNDRTGALTQVSKEGRNQTLIKPSKSSSFKKVADFLFSKDGRLFVSDSGSNEILILKPALSEKKDWKDFSVDSRFVVPKAGALALSGDDVVAVADNKAKVIHVYSIDGVPLYDLFPAGKVGFKDVVSLDYAPDGTLWALDQGTNQLHRFSSKRKWLGSVRGLPSPQRVTVDDYGYAYVTSSKGKWFEIKPDGKSSGSFGTKGKKPGQMSKPIGLVLINNNNIWVAENGNARLQSFTVSHSKKVKKVQPTPTSRIQIRKVAVWPSDIDKAVFNQKGDLLLFQKKKGTFEWISPDGKTMATFKKRKGGVVTPVDVALSKDGDVWVVDAKDHKIKKVSNEGDVEADIAGKGRYEGALNGPTHLLVREDGSFLVVDKSQSRLQALGPDGLFLFGLKKGKAKKGEFETISDLAVNKERIIIIDNKRKALLFFDQTGNFIAEIANKEDKKPIWDDLADVTTDMNGRIYILDKGSGRVRVFYENGKFLADFFVSGDRLSLGPDGRVFVQGAKEAHIFQLEVVPKKLKNASVKDVEGVITLTWDTCVDCGAFEIDRSSHQFDYAHLATITSDSYEDETVRAGVPYTYRIRGISPSGYKGNWFESKPIKPSRRKDISLISFGDISLKPVFTSAYKTYATKPIGEIEVRNNDDRVYRNVKLSLGLKKYTDFATEKVLRDLQPGERRLVPVTLTFNDTVLELTENTPVQLDTKLVYFEDNQEKKVSRNVPLTLYSRNAIVWDDKRRMSSFVTPRDAPIVEFSRKGISHFLLKLKASTVGKPLAKAALFYEAMNALEIGYVPDPTTPYAEAAGNPETIDYVQFPRETLRRRTGDCDDTTALLASLLESIGVDTALVDTPGHIFLMVDLNESDPDVIGLPEERFVEYQGTLWVPIETTKLGQNFLEAWKVGTAQVKEARANGTIEFIPILGASEAYPPVTLVEREKEKVDFPKNKVETSFIIVMEKLQKERYDAQVESIKQLMRENPKNDMLHIQLGMAHVEGGKIEDGKKIFLTYLKQGPNNVQAAANNNMGNLAYLKSEFAEAETFYNQAALLADDDGGIVIKPSPDGLEERRESQS